MTELAQMRLQDAMDFYPDEGIMRWRFCRGRLAKAGTVAGNVRPDGYVQIKIDQSTYLRSRLAWLFVHGRWPTEIDHINGDRSDDRLENLREATRSQNISNCRQRVGSSGFRGVSKHGNRFVAKITQGGNEHYLGTFPTAEAAAEAYRVASEKLHGEFAFHKSRGVM
jgi:hypothetical protein